MSSVRCGYSIKVGCTTMKCILFKYITNLKKKSSFCKKLKANSFFFLWLNERRKKNGDCSIIQAVGLRGSTE